MEVVFETLKGLSEALHHCRTKVGDATRRAEIVADNL